ncbi:MAG: RNA polymerase sigma-70 factor [Syntrophothermus sp.]
METPAGFLDKNSFETLFRKEFKGLVVFATRFVKDIEVAKDIVHDGFIVLWEKREQVDLSANVKSLLVTTIRNRCLNWLRDNKKFDKNIVSLEETFSERVYEPADRLEENETRVMISTAIGQLPERCREVFILNRFENKKYKEVADTLGISVKTVEAQMSKALDFLRKKLKTETRQAPE